MPQFDVTFFSSQFFWLAIVFCALYFLVSRFIAPKAEYILTSRNRYLDENIEHAEEYNIKAKTLSEYKLTAFAEVNTQVEDIQKQATKILEENFNNQKSAMESSLSEQKKKSLLKIDKYTKQFRTDQIDPSINLASFIIHKITNKSADLKHLQQIHGKIK